MKKFLAKYLYKPNPAGFNLWLLNFVLRHTVPFNAPHGFKVLKADSESVEVLIPFRRANHNHIGGLHACALATGAEFASGLALLRKLGPVSVRLVMKCISVDYHYQGRTDCTARARFTDSEISLLSDALEAEGEAEISAISSISDSDSNAVATATIVWHLKEV